MTAVVLLYMFTRFRSRAVKPGLQQRALAAAGGDDGDSEDEALEAILNVCLATGATFEQSEEYEDQPAAKKARLESSLRSAAAEFEARQVRCRRLLKLRNLWRELFFTLNQVLERFDLGSEWWPCYFGSSATAGSSYTSTTDESTVTAAPSGAGSEHSDRSSAISTARPQTRSGSEQLARTAASTAVGPEVEPLTSAGALGELPQRRPWNPSRHPFVRLPEKPSLPADDPYRLLCAAESLVVMCRYEL
ncbi:hypothetical protein Efla_007579 [Eimeria flavescens]